MQKARSHTFTLKTCIVLPLLVSIRFQILFHSPSGVLFTFPSRYLFSIGGRWYLVLGGGPPGFPQGFSCPVVLGCLTRSPLLFIYWAFTICGRPFHAVRLNTGFFTPSQRIHPLHVRSRYSHNTTHVCYHMLWVWTLPVSLAATQGITTVFFSSGY